MITEERWIPGTGFPVTLVRTDDAASGQTLTVFSTAVRNGEDGVGFTFLPSADNEQHDGYAYGTTRMDLTKLAQFLKGLPLSRAERRALEARFLMAATTIPDLYSGLSSCQRYAPRCPSRDVGILSFFQAYGDFPLARIVVQSRRCGRV